MRWTYRIGAVSYALWGLLHVYGGLLMLRADTREQLGYVSSEALPTEQIPPTLEPLVHAVVSYHAYNITWFGLFALLVAVFLNWRNSIVGYWANLVVVGADDIGLMVFLLLPGHLSFAEVGLGPLLFVLAALFTTIGLWTRPKRAP